MRYLIIVCVFFSFLETTKAQDRKADSDILIGLNKDSKASGSDGFFKGLFSIYQNHFSEQILNDCIYEHSCSTFSQGAIRHFGLVKGLFLTTDRLTRCNRATLTQIAPVRINGQGKIKDHWEAYSFSE